MALTDKCPYMTHHFILLQLNSFDLRVDRQGCQFEHSVSSLRVWWSAEGAKNFSWPWLSPLCGWGNLAMAFTGKLVYMAHYFILLQLNLFYLRVDREGWWFEHSMSQLRSSLLAEGAKKVFLPWLSPLQGWGSLTMVDTEGGWFEHAMSQLQVCLSVENAKNVFQPLLSPPRGWVSVTMTFTGKVLYMAHHFILLRFNTFDLRIVRERLWFKHSMTQLRVCLSAEGATSVFWPWVSPP